MTVSPGLRGGSRYPPGQLSAEQGPGPQAQRCGPTPDRNETRGAARSRPSVSSGQVLVPGAWKLPPGSPPLMCGHQAFQKMPPPEGRAERGSTLGQSHCEALQCCLFMFSV